MNPEVCPAPPDLLTFGRLAVRSSLEALARTNRLRGLAAVDGTCGNGHDTAFLAGCLDSLPGGAACPVLSFDVQAAALEEARKRADIRPFLNRIHFLAFGHEHLAEALAERGDGAPLAVAAAVYNLGFLPGSDKRVVTKARSTVASLAAAAAALAPGGLLSVHAYGGHAGGAEEMAAVKDWFTALSHKAWLAASYRVCNKKRNPEILFLAGKRMEHERPER